MSKIRDYTIALPEELFMSDHQPHDPNSHDVDPAEAIVDVIPWLLPLAGGVLIFLLAFIAVFMA
jgi:hypothetical protein